MIYTVFLSTLFVHVGIRAGSGSSSTLSPLPSHHCHSEKIVRVRYASRVQPNRDGCTTNRSSTCHHMPIDTLSMCVLHTPPCHLQNLSATPPSVFVFGFNLLFRCTFVLGHMLSHNFRLSIICSLFWSLL